MTEDEWCEKEDRLKDEKAEANTETNMSHKIVKEWNTEAGPKAVILFAHGSHHCGYVSIPKDHPLFGKDYDYIIPMELSDIILKDQKIGKRGSIDLLSHDPENTRAEFLFNVHGGITYSQGSKDYPVKSEEESWWYGYDCAHSGDETKGKFNYKSKGDVFRDEAYCVNECESLAKQIMEVSLTLS